MFNSSKDICEHIKDIHGEIKKIMKHYYPYPSDWYTTYSNEQKAPPIYYKKTENAHTLSIELPGVSKKDITVTLLKSRSVENNQIKVMWVRDKKRFSISFTDIMTEDITASCENGILTIILHIELRVNHDGVPEIFCDGVEVKSFNIPPTSQPLPSAATMWYPCS